MQLPERAQRTGLNRHLLLFESEISLINLISQYSLMQTAAIPLATGQKRPGGRGSGVHPIGPTTASRPTNRITPPAVVGADWPENSDSTKSDATVVLAGRAGELVEDASLVVPLLAEILDVDHKTVLAARKRLESTWEVPKLTKRLRKDGKDGVASYSPVVANTPAELRVARRITPSSSRRGHTLVSPTPRVLLGWLALRG